MELSVDLISWQVSQPAGRLAAMAATLSPDEHARADAFRFARHRNAWIAARGGLRRVLAQRLALHPENLRFDYGSQGRPSLPGPLRFSLSHAGDWAALALCEGEDPGLDIEAVRPIDLATGHYHFAPEECAALEGLPPGDRLPAFFRCWTRKEAVIKAIGRGLAMPLTDFAVNLSPEARLLRIKGDAPQAWALRQLSAGPGMVASLALRIEGRGLALRYCSGWLGLPHVPSRHAQENTQGSGWGRGRDGCRSHG